MSDVVFGIGQVGSSPAEFLVDSVDVYVILVDGLEWLLAWRQIGLEHLKVVVGSDRASAQLDVMESTLGHLLPRMEKLSGGPGALREAPVSSIVCVTGMSEAEIDVLRSILVGFCGRIIGLAPNPGRRRRLSFEALGAWKWISMEARHRLLGGLTTARLRLCWTEANEDTATKMRFEFPKVHRDRSLFLEPSARLGRWEWNSDRIKGPIWDAANGTDWMPWPVDPTLWIHTYSVFFKTNLYRPLGDKEWAQAMDLRPEWGEGLRPIYKLWRQGEHIPLRFLVELGMHATGTQVRGLGTLVSSQLDVSNVGRKICPSLLTVADGEQRSELVKYFGWSREGQDTAGVEVATTNDDAAVKFHIWAVGGDSPEFEKAREGLRAMAFRWWIIKTRKEVISWLKVRKRTHPKEVEADTEGIRDCLTRLANSTWFEWTDGSRTHFWRWPERWLLEARDGATACVVERPPRRLHWPPLPQEEWMEDLDVEKIAKLISRRYIEAGPVKVVIPRMCVPKGDDDVRVVWDMTRNGVNPGLFASTFYLIGIYSLMDRIDEGMWIADFDCGEMFNNYTLHESEREYAGVYLSDSVRKKLWDHYGEKFKKDYGWTEVPRFLRWARLPFGWRPSPIMAIRMMMRSIELAKGRPDDLSSPFQFSTIRLNLPTMSDYDPGLRRVIKLRSDGKPASDAFVFVDDGRIAGFDQIMANKASRHVVGEIQRRGTQDAARKREAASTRPRAWTGGVVYTDKGMLRKFLVKKKWIRIQTIVRSVLEGGDLLERKPFESGIGFLIHASATYSFLRPYLVGFYLAMNLHLGDRDDNGWRLRADKVDEEEGMTDFFDSVTADTISREMNKEANDVGQAVRDNVPEQTLGPGPVPVTDLLRRNAQTILRLCQGEEPVQLLVRPIKGSDNVAYAGSDASGEGFGFRDWFPDKHGEFVSGYWLRTTEDSSSNWREMRTCVDKIRRDVETNRLEGREVFFVTDNSTLERAFYKGYSSSPALYEMVEDLRALSIQGSFILRIVHVAGTRMIDLGIDGLSRGELELGLMRKALRDRIPLATSPIERSPQLLDWILTWIDSDSDWKVATPLD